MSEAGHVRKLFSQTLLYGAGMLLNRSTGIILLPLYTAYFSTEEMGIYAIIFSVWVFLNVIYLAGLETSFLKFYIDAKEKELKGEIYFNTILTVGIIALILSGVLYFISPLIAEQIEFSSIERGTELLRILAFVLAIDGIYRIPLLLLRAELNAKSYLWINFLTIILNLLFNIILIVQYGLKTEAILYAYLISAAVTFIVSVIFSLKKLKLRVSFDKIKQLLAYGNKFIYTGVFLILIEQSDRFFLKYFYDESTVGIYQTGYRLAAIMSLAIGAFRFSWVPYFLNIADDAKNKQIISKILNAFLFAGVSLAVILTFLLSPMVKGLNLIPEAYWSGLSILPVILFSYFFAGLGSLFNAGPFYKDKTSFMLFLAAGGFAIYTILNLILIPAYGIIGAACSVLIVNILMCAAAYLYSQKIYRIEYDKIYAIKLMLSAAAAIIIYSLMNARINETISGIIGLILFMVLIFLLGLFNKKDLKMVIKR